MVLERSEIPNDSSGYAKRWYSVGEALFDVGLQFHYDCSKLFKNRALRRGHTVEVLVNFACAHEPLIDAKRRSPAASLQL